MSTPIFTEPMDCLPVTRLPEGPGWTYEVKLDGYRAQAIQTASGVRLLSRRGKDLSRQFPVVHAALNGAVPPGSVIDGEIVALDPQGRPRFNLLQNAKTNGAPVVFYAFDILALAGRNVRLLPLSDRQQLLRNTLRTTDLVQVSESFTIPAERMLALVKEHGLEGVVAKRLGSRYEAGRRSGAWQKTRVNLSQEFVVGGFRPGTNGVDSLVLGFYRDAPPLTREQRARLPKSRRQYVVQPRELVYCARVRAGFVPASRRELAACVKPLITTHCPFVNLPEATAGRWGQGLTVEKMRECVWVRPKLVVQCAFLEWTASDHLRHVRFLGVREDKDALAVMKET